MRNTFLRRSFTVAAVVVILVLVHANAKALAIGAIHTYQRALSPLAERAGAHCRFSLSCSRYGEIVIARDGVASGGWKTLKRIAKCHPWTPMGTVDEP